MSQAKENAEFYDIWWCVYCDNKGDRWREPREGDAECPDCGKEREQWIATPDIAEPAP